MEALEPFHVREKFLPAPSWCHERSRDVLSLPSLLPGALQPPQYWPLPALTTWAILPRFHIHHRRAFVRADGRNSAETYRESAPNEGKSHDEKKASLRLSMDGIRLVFQGVTVGSTNSLCWRSGDQVGLFLTCLVFPPSLLVSVWPDDLTSPGRGSSPYKTPYTISRGIFVTT